MRRRKSRFCGWSKSTPSWIYFAREGRVCPLWLKDAGSLCYTIAVVKNLDFVVDPNRRHLRFIREGTRGSEFHCDWNTRGRYVTLSQAEKISILWLIQIDAILDFSERVWVRVQEPSRASFPKDGHRAISAISLHCRGSFIIVEASLTFFRKKCHVFLEKCTFETPKPNQRFVHCSSRVQKAKFSSFNKPKVLWAIVVFWVVEKYDGKRRRHRLKRLYSDW